MNQYASFSRIILAVIASTLLLSVTLSCDSKEKDKQTQDNIVAVLLHSDNAERWEEVEVSVNRGVATLHIPPWLDGEEAQLREELNGVDELKDVEFEIDQDATRDPALLVVRRTGDVGWQVEACVPEQDQAEALVRAVETAAGTTEIEREFNVSDRYVEPEHLDAFERILIRVAMQIEDLELRLEGDELTIRGTCLSQPFCEGLTTELDELDVEYTLDLKSYAWMVVDSTPTSLNVEGKLADSMDVDRLHRCLFPDEAAMEAADIDIELLESASMRPEMEDAWCELLRAARPPLTNFTIFLEGPRARVLGDVESSEEYDEISDKLPSVDQLITDLRLNILAATDFIEAECTSSGVRLSGTVTSDDAESRFRAILNEHERTRQSSIALESLDSGAISTPSVEAVELLPSVCDALGAGGKMIVYGKELRVSGRVADQAAYDELLEKFGQLSRLDLTNRALLYASEYLSERQAELEDRMYGEEFEFLPLSSQPTAEGREAIAALITFLRDYPDVEVTMVVHSDGPGSTRFHDNLSSERSRAITDSVYQSNANDHQIRRYSVGRERPLADPRTQSGQLANTTVELFVTGYFRR